jgi:predicted esterase
LLAVELKHRFALDVRLTTRGNPMNHIRLTIALLLIASTALAVPAAMAAPDSGELTKAEESAFKAIAKEWMSLGSWAAGKGLATMAKDAVARAEALEPDLFGLEKLKEKVADMTDSATDSDISPGEKKRESYQKKIADKYEKLYSSGARETEPAVVERFEEYLWVAVELDGSDKRWGSVYAIARKAVDGKETEKGLAMADRALGKGVPESMAGKFREIGDDACKGKLILRQASTHPMKYYFSLPSKYERKKGKKWPVMVCVDGAGSNFEGMGRGYMNNRADLPLIVVSPCSFSNTNQISGNEGQEKKYRKYYTDEVIKQGDAGGINWDEQGILAVLKDMRDNYDAEDRVYCTGFSGGGNCTYMMIFNHPDMVAGAAPACANFSGFQTDQLIADLKDKFTKEDRNFPVHLITGEKDAHRDFTHGDKSSPGIEPQTDAAERLLKGLGYGNWSRKMYDGMGHSSAVKEVLDFLKPYIEGTKKRSDPQ